MRIPHLVIQRREDGDLEFLILGPSGPWGRPMTGAEARALVDAAKSKVAALLADAKRTMCDAAGMTALTDAAGRFDAFSERGWVTDPSRVIEVAKADDAATVPKRRGLPRPEKRWVVWDRTRSLEADLETMLPAAVAERVAVRVAEAHPDPEGTYKP